MSETITYDPLDGFFLWLATELLRRGWTREKLLAATVTLVEDDHGALLSISDDE